MDSEDITDWLQSEREDNFHYFVQRLTDAELDAFLIRGVKIHELLSMERADRSTLGTVEVHLRKLKQEQQRRAMSRVIPLPHRVDSSPPKLVRPPQLIYGRLLRCFLRPAAYTRFVEPHIEDMHTEYIACIAKGDEQGARWAVIRAHLYVIPSWAWALVASVIARVIEWIRT